MPSLHHTSTPSAAVQGYGHPRPVNPASLDAVMAAAGLTPHEAHVVRQRLPGRSYAEIATDDAMRKPDGTRYTRQRVQQVERDALAKLGLPAGFTLASSVHADDAADRAARMLERAGLVRAAELHADPAEARRGRGLKAPRWEREHEAAVAAFLKAAGE